MEQFESVMGRTIDKEGSLQLKVATGAPKAMVEHRVPVEGEAIDLDGMGIAVLLHVADGHMKEIEIFRLDSEAIERPVSAEDMEVGVFGQFCKRLLWTVDGHEMVSEDGNRSWSSADDELLRRVVQEHAPHLSPLLKPVGHRKLETEEREALRGALAYELTAAGLEDNDEPNKYGLELDELIGRLMYF